MRQHKDESSCAKAILTNQKGKVQVENWNLLKQKKEVKIPKEP